MRNRHLSKLTGNTTYIYLFALDSTNSIKMKELDVIGKPKITEQSLSMTGRGVEGI